MDYEKRCDNCDFKYCEAYEEQVYSCMFDFERCKLTEFEKKKIKRLENQLECACEEICIAKEKEKTLLKKRHTICKEINKYLKTLKKKGKVFYE